MILKNSRIKELSGVVLIAFAIFSLISIISYSPKDSSFKKQTSAANSVKATNYGGVVGSYLSDGIIQTFGTAAYAVSFFIFALGVHSFLQTNGKDYFVSLLGSISFCLFFSTFLYIYCKNGDPAFGTRMKAGGIVGYIVGEVFITYFNRTGSIVIVVAAILSSLILSTRFSFVKVFSSTGIVLSQISIFLIGAFGVFKGLIKKGLETVKKKDSSDRKERKKKVKIAVRSSEVENKKEKEAVLHQGKFDFMQKIDGYQLPPLSLLDTPPVRNRKKQNEEFTVKSSILEKKLADFGVHGKVVQVMPGPIITRYEFEPAAGVKVSKIMNLADDLALGMRAISIRILAPVPGKAVVGIEIPNVNREAIHLKEVLVSDHFKKKSTSTLILGLGKDIAGEIYATNLLQIPHLLIAGATGSGKSVGVNSMICSILFNKTPDEVKLLMIDPKMIELSIYDGIPHLIAPVVTDPKKAAAALKWVVGEMEKRYKLLSEKKVKSIDAYNKSLDAEEKKTSVREDDMAEQEEDKKERLPYIVVIIDELADLMMVSTRDVEMSLTRLAQMARAAGIHLLLATQRPSVDVLTGIIKANFPARISFQVSSRPDSRTILDSIGAERLLGRGDMLFLPPGTSRIERVHGALVTEDEINRIVEFVKKQNKSKFKEPALDFKINDEKEKSLDDEEYDEKYDEAVAIVAKTRQASISMLQRRLRVGYNRSARMIEAMEKEGVVGPADGAKPRRVLVNEI